MKELDAALKNKTKQNKTKTKQKQKTKQNKTYIKNKRTKHILLYFFVQGVGEEK